MRQGRLVDTTTSLQSQGAIPHIVSPSLSFLLQYNTEYKIYDGILADFPFMTKTCAPPHPVKHTITHHINATGLPVHAWASVCRLTTFTYHQIPVEYSKDSNNHTIWTIWVMSHAFQTMKCIPNIPVFNGPGIACTRLLLRLYWWCTCHQTSARYMYVWY